MRIQSLRHLENERFYYTLPILNADAILKVFRVQNPDLTHISFNSKFVESRYLVVLFNSPIKFIKEASKKSVYVFHNNSKLKKGYCSLLSRSSLVKIKHAVVNDITRHFKILGVTGTKGKTTTAWFAYQMLKKIGFNPAYIGTLGVVFERFRISTRNTTPSLEFILNALVILRNLNCDSVVIECSSIGLHQGRLDGIQFDWIVFTGLGHDHLDYHGTMKKYFQAKELLFGMLKKSKKSERLALIIGEDRWSYLLEQKYSKSFKIIKLIPSKLRIIKNSLLVSEFEYNKEKFQTKFFFKHFALYALGLLKLLNESSGKKLEIHFLKKLELPEGRFELVGNRVVVDYAHTPESLQEAILAVKSAVKAPVVVVFGCGGNRDPSKRALMGKAAATYADYTIITSDNPRYEDPNTIADQVAKGLSAGANYEIIIDRKKAIQKGIQKALELNGYALIAGKGHEIYQIVGSKRQRFDDRQVARSFLKHASIHPK
ncbi:MAG: UDP-N-acetylmuramyl-tripeptide synthetase [Deltaproteobacteria bacterium]|nr:UDP-N-acetylmuramyl-tripeptide synthetase [Deltaproteobacteria bacterium]